MADEELLEPVDEMGDDDEEEEEGGGSSLMSYLPWVLGVLVLQVIIGYLIVSWFFGSPADAPATDGQEMVGEEMAGDGSGEGEGAAGPLIIQEVIYERMDPIVVNPAGTEGLRFLSATVHLGLANAKVETEIETKNLKSKIIDKLYRILSSKTIPQLDPERHGELKDEIKESLNEFLGTNAVIDVYFQGFVLQ